MLWQHAASFLQGQAQGNIHHPIEQPNNEPAAEVRAEVQELVVAPEGAEMVGH